MTQDTKSDEENAMTDPKEVKIGNRTYLFEPDPEEYRPRVVLCPFHKEKTASCFVDWAELTFHCISCGKTGIVCDKNPNEPVEFKIVFTDKEEEEKTNATKADQR